VQGEDGGPGYTPKVCIFHTRGQNNCCVWRTWAYKRSGESQARRSGVHGTLALDDLKPVSGMEVLNTIKTEITSRPRAARTNEKGDGPAPKARKLLGLFRRESIDEQKNDEDDDVGIHDKTNLASGTDNVSDPNGITVQYDVTRTVEDLRNGKLSSQDGTDCISCIEEEMHRQNGDIV
jgi:hypothetical protein